MDFKIIWSDAAIADLQDIWAYIAQHDSQAAERVGRGIVESEVGGEETKDRWESGMRI